MKLTRFVPWLLLIAWYPACSSRTDESHGVGDGRPPGRGGAIGLGGTSSNGGSTSSGGTGNVIIGGGTTGDPDGGMTGPCQGLECDQTTCTLGSCRQMPCEAGTSTTVSGIVHDPAGKVPIYNVIVYVPSAPVTPFAEGAQCDRCGQNIENPVTSTLTGTDGRFVLPDVPVGENIPIVIQIGKWRRQLTLPNVPRCVDTPTDPGLTRLPRNKAEGDIPLIAITTGGADSMECLPLRMGIDPAEFTNGTGDGRIHLYAGGDVGNNLSSTKQFDSGTALSNATELWDSVDDLSRYDIVILSCEGDELQQQKPTSARQALYDYSVLGGRVFASHWHHIWLSEGPDPVPDIGQWRNRRDPESPTTATINTSFDKGQALAQWLVNVGASTTPGEMQVYEPRDNIQSVNATYATEWMRTINTNEQSTPAIQYLSFNTSLTVDESQQCGRVVYTDLHVSNTSDANTPADSPGDPFPSHCQMRDLSAQEKAVEFMLFDLSSCIQDDDVPPEPPR